MFASSLNFWYFWFRGLSTQGINISTTGHKGSTIPEAEIVT
jgi:hypothetical protein